MLLPSVTPARAARVWAGRRGRQGVRARTARAWQRARRRAARATASCLRRACRLPTWQLHRHVQRRLPALVPWLHRVGGHLLLLRHWSNQCPGQGPASPAGAQPPWQPGQSSQGSGVKGAQRVRGRDVGAGGFLANGRPTPGACRQARAVPRVSKGLCTDVQDRRESETGAAAGSRLGEAGQAGPAALAPSASAALPGAAAPPLCLAAPPTPLQPSLITRRAERPQLAAPDGRPGRSAAAV